MRHSGFLRRSARREALRRSRQGIDGTNSKRNNRSTRRLQGPSTGSSRGPRIELRARPRASRPSSPRVLRGLEPSSLRAARASQPRALRPPRPPSFGLAALELSRGLELFSPRAARPRASQPRASQPRASRASFARDTPDRERALVRGLARPRLLVLAASPTPGERPWLASRRPRGEEPFELPAPASWRFFSS